MSFPEEHHYLPQFLLAPWCGEDGMLTAFSKPYQDKVVARRYAPSAVAKRANLYTYIGMPEGKAQVLETVFFQKVDHEGALALQAAFANGANTITRDQRAQLAVFLMSLRVRHPDAIAMIRKEGAEGLVAALDRDPEEAVAAGLAPVQRLSELVHQDNPALIENFGLSILPEIATNPNYLNRLARLDWVDVQFPAAAPELVISDRALLLRGDLLTECVMVLPVGPRRAMLINSDRRHIDAFRQLPPKEQVRSINKWSVEEAVEYVYARGVEHLPLVKRRLRRRPDRGRRELE
ncbi:MAG: DUF4238 domain-containing protein [Reyranella sp.]|uniref:DUF4238 domain-containing protein n=1 Tax=Reyranella sp. TaxID=1929291 RepID=UPI001ACCF02C|nr:DUF4238 domain-containing protein [Reyranella sp.]MBN9091647.1 DUF4238 domain-containing protein [Reyranella sp.]